jgi:hypothetical protein
VVVGFRDDEGIGTLPHHFPLLRLSSSFTALTMRVRASSSANRTALQDARAAPLCGGEAQHVGTGHSLVFFYIYIYFLLTLFINTPACVAHCRTRPCA